jgi:hypothetical protein
MKTRGRVSLEARLDNKLSSYVTAAGATANSSRDLVAATAICAVGLGSLVSVPFAYAEIVYTPAHQQVGIRSGPSSLGIDLNHDGVVDVTISAYNFASFSSGDHVFHALDAFGNQNNSILATDRSLIADAPQGQIVGAVSVAGQFVRGGVMASCRFDGGGGSTFSSSKGLWQHAVNRYLGVKFDINGETHYGWARLTAGAGGATLTGYAYETIPDKPIPAGVVDTASPETGSSSSDDIERRAQANVWRTPASLGLLARGAGRARKRPTREVRCF